MPAEKALFLSTTPLSPQFKSAAEDKLGVEAFEVSFRELRSLGAVKILQYLRRQKCELACAVIEDEASLVMEPLLNLFTALTKAPGIAVVSPDLSVRRISRAGAAWQLARIASASVNGQVARYLCQRELDKILVTPRINAVRGGGAVVYMNTDMWFGPKIGGSVGHVAGVVNEFSKRDKGVVFYSANGFTMIGPAAGKMVLQPPAVYGRPHEVNIYSSHFRFADYISKTAPEKPAFIYQRLSLGNFTGVAVSRRLKVPLVMEYNGSGVWIAGNWGAGRLRYQKTALDAEEACFRHAHLMVTVSNALRDELIGRGVPASRIVMAPNAVDENIFNPSSVSQERRGELRRAHGIPDDAIVATFVGTFGRWHGAEVLAEAAGLAVKMQEQKGASKKLWFLFIGDGLTAPQSKEIINSGPARERTTFTGFIRQDLAPQYLAASDILVSPHVPNADGSRFFGSPTKLFEYMAMAKPIVASDLEQVGETISPGIRIGEIESKGGDIAGNGEVGVLVTPGSAEELARALVHLAEMPKTRGWLGSNARNLALQKYTWRRHVDKIVEGLGAALESGK